MTFWGARHGRAVDDPRTHGIITPEKDKWPAEGGF
jgi:hypothetical protein